MGRQSFAGSSRLVSLCDWIGGSGRTCLHILVNVWKSDRSAARLRWPLRWITLIAFCQRYCQLGVLSSVLEVMSLAHSLSHP